MGGSRPGLSVIIPSHRADPLLAECLRSVLTQAGEDVGITVEILVVDDGSAGGEVGALVREECRDPRVSVVRSPVTVGPGPARNLGLTHATGEHVWFVDADDWLPAGSLSAVATALAGPPVDVLIVDHAEMRGRSVHRRRTLARLGGLSGPTTVGEHPRLLRLAPSACTKIIRRAWLDSTGVRFPPGRYEDAYFSAAILMAAHRIGVLDRVCYCYRLDAPGSFTGSTGAAHFDIFDQYERIFARLAEARHAEAPGGGGPQRLAPEVFRVMVDHYLVVLGHATRLPPGRRRDFFGRVVADFRRWHPAGGYPRPAGVAGLKHRLVRVGAYPPYALMRTAYRAWPARAAR